MNAEERVLVVAEATEIRVGLAEVLTAAGRTVTKAPSGLAALGVAADVPPDVLVVHGELPDVDANSWPGRVHDRWPEAEVIVLFADGLHLDTILAWEKTDVFAVLENPTRHRVQETVRDAFETRRAWEEAREIPARPPAAIVGRSRAIQAVCAQVAKIARSRGAALLLGETGTGKGLVASTIHEHSGSSGQFVVVNLAAVPRELAESELFGHVRGAFTGATGNRKGAFELAGTGTVLLDEVGEAPLPLQAKLLRVLGERRFTPVGGEREVKVKAQVIVATNRDLGRMVREGSFRVDLYHRLNVLTIWLPPLRERPEDVEDLVPCLLSRQLSGERISRKPWRITEGAMAALSQPPWPGNVRELDHCLERARVRARGSVIRLRDLDLSDDPKDQSVSVTSSPARAATAGVMPAAGAPPFGAGLPTRRAAEEWLIRSALEQTANNVSAAAKLLGMPRSTLRRRIVAIGIQRRMDAMG